MALTRLKSPDAAARWLREWVTGTLRSDSREVQPGDAFIAWPGYVQDGRQFARTALVGGAATCLVEHEGVEAFAFDDARIASLPQLKAATGAIAGAFFGAPSAALDVVAVTGTNGKTSTAWWIAQAASLLGRRFGVVGTLGIGEPPGASAGEGEPPAGVDFTGLTTPDPVRLQAALRRFADAGFAGCAMEASSIGIVEHRLAGVHVGVALFTNFTRDHLDYHGDMETYWAAKRALFDRPGLQAAVVNVDDERGAALAAELATAGAGAPALWTYTVRGGDVHRRAGDATRAHDGADARLCASALRYEGGGLAFELHERAEGGEPASQATLKSTLIGAYNAHNLLAVIGGLRALGVPLADAAGVVPQLTPVPGRMQRVPPVAGAPDVVVDYAHTPDALEKALQALRPFAQARGGRLWCVFGCGGDRDATKRPLMGAAAERGADRVVITSDNPRGEAPGDILAQIAAGLAARERAAIVENRREAIALSIAQADANDVLLLAGKGHEDYQEIAGVKHPFSDVAEARAALDARAGGLA